jgi:hypothetical protein
MEKGGGGGLWFVVRFYPSVIARYEAILGRQSEFAKLTLKPRIASYLAMTWCFKML